MNSIMLLLVKIFAVTLAWTLVQSSQRDKLFFLQKSGERNETLLVVTWTATNTEIEAGCEFFTDKELINEVLQSSRDSSIQTLSGDEMQNLLEDCTEISLIRRKRESGDEETDEESSSSFSRADVIDNLAAARRREKKRRRNNSTRQGKANQSNRVATTTLMDENEIESTTEILNDESTTEISSDEPTTAAGYNGLPIVFPGTKWCGAGDRAKNYEDLGMSKGTDVCCRAHDNCNDTFAPGETRYNLTNKSSFTKLSCQCDNDFYDCLDQVDSITSNTIGNMYFNILRRECYEFDYPLTTKCKKYRTFLKLVCLEYERNTTAPRVYHWVPAKQYSKIPHNSTVAVTVSFLH